MSQFDFASINTAETDGVELAALLENWRDALNSMHSGSTAPPYATKGTLWLDTSATNPVIRVRGETSFIAIGEIDLNTNIFRPFIGAALAGVLATRNVVGTNEIEDGAVTSSKIGNGAILAAALGTDVINASHIDSAAGGDIRALLGLGSAALLEGSAFGPLAFLSAIAAGNISAEGADEGEVLQVDAEGDVVFGALDVQSSGNLINYEVFTATDVWTKLPECNFVVVTVVGAGGGTGTGGTSSFGAHCSATGGSPGSLAGGAGGVGLGGDVNIQGGYGASGNGQGFNLSAPVPGLGGSGGSSYLGGGGRGAAAGSSSNVSATGGGNYGGGGGGGASSSTSNNNGLSSFLGLGGGGGGGAAIKRITTGLGITENITVGGGAAVNGGDGVVIVESYT